MTELGNISGQQACNAYICKKKTDVMYYISCMYRFSCAAVCQESMSFQFLGSPRIWDGQTIRRNIKGNSVLYIVMDGNRVQAILSCISVNSSFHCIVINMMYF